MLVATVNLTLLIHSYIPKRSFQQVPVLQYAGFPSEGNSRESENAPVCQKQPGLPATVGVSCLYYLILILIKSVFELPVDMLAEVWLFFRPPAWWCSWPETCKLTSTPTSLISSSSSPRCWTPRTQSSWSGLSLLSHTSTSTCGGSW